MIGIVYSTMDPAGSGIAGYLVSSLKPTKSHICKDAEVCYQGEGYIIAGYTEDVLYFDFLDHSLPDKVSFYVVLSRHASEAQVKSYTVHATGNFTDTAIAGGKPRELGIAQPRAMWTLLRALYESRESYRRFDYEVSYEATHHGPTSLSRPLVFIEIGSSIEEWNDTVNHSVVGSAVMKLIEIYPNLPSCIVSIGIGGGHYARKHTELSLSENVCYSHIASKYVLDSLDHWILDNMIKRSAERPVQIIVERKGTRREHRELVETYAHASRLNIRLI